MAFRNSGVAVGTTFTNIYTCPTNYECVMHSLYFSNLDSVNTISIDVKVTLNKTGQGEKVILKNVTIPAGTSLIFDKPITLRPGDIIAAKASMASVCESVASMLLTLEDTTAPN